MNKASFEKLLEPLNNFGKVWIKEEIYFAIGVLGNFNNICKRCNGRKKEYDVLYNNLIPRKRARL